uniref:Putative secreted protein n=1 Tax=Anopheles marajoara TaxID=58244 RepID=A0A2M4CET3_9DIPT
MATWPHFLFSCFLFCFFSPTPSASSSLWPIIRVAGQIPCTRDVCARLKYQATACFRCRIRTLPLQPSLR